MVLEDGLIVRGLVIETWNVHLIGEFVADGILPIVECRGGRARGILFVKKCAQAPGLLPAIRVLLLWNLIADAPHDDAGMVAIPTRHIPQVTFRPLVEILAIAVGYLGYAPHIEGLV